MTHQQVVTHGSVRGGPGTPVLLLASGVVQPPLHLVGLLLQTDGDPVALKAGHLKELLTSSVLYMQSINLQIQLL